MATNGNKDASEVIDQVCEAAASWPKMAREVGVPEEMVNSIVGNMVRLINI